MDKKRSAGITVVAWAEIIIGGLVAIISSGLLVIFTIFYIFPALTGQHSSDPEYIGWMMVGVIASGILALPSILIFISGINILKLKSWARMFNIGLAIALPIYAFIILFIAASGNSAYIPAVSICVSPALILALLKVWYFTRQSVKEQFKKV